MKLIIDIPEDRYDEIHSLKFVMYGLQSEENKKLFYRLINAVLKSTPIPDNATVGEVFCMLACKEPICETASYFTIDKKLWNSPYQKGGKTECWKI